MDWLTKIPAVKSSAQVNSFQYQFELSVQSWHFLAGHCMHCNWSICRNGTDKTGQHKRANIQRNIPHLFVRLLFAYLAHSVANNNDNPDRDRPFVTTIFSTTSPSNTCITSTTNHKMTKNNIIHQPEIWKTEKGREYAPSSPNLRSSIWFHLNSFFPHEMPTTKSIGWQHNENSSTSADLSRKFSTEAANFVRNVRNQKENEDENKMPVELTNMLFAGC